MSNWTPHDIRAFTKGQLFDLIADTKSGNPNAIEQSVAFVCGDSLGNWRVKANGRVRNLLQLIELTIESCARHTGMIRESSMVCVRLKNRADFRQLPRAHPGTQALQKRVIRVDAGVDLVEAGKPLSNWTQIAISVHSTKRCPRSTRL